jgi:hypothetical protein
MPKGVYQHISSWNKDKHLSKEHRRKLSESHKGYIMPEEQKRKISESHKKIGAPWMRGKKHTKEWKEKMSIVHKKIGAPWMKGKFLKEENPAWKGEKASYWAKHMWISNNFGRPKKCEFCGVENKKMYHWANLSGNYLRETNDWIRVCVPCHKKFDMGRISINL